MNASHPIRLVPPELAVVLAVLLLASCDPTEQVAAIPKQQEILLGPSLTVPGNDSVHVWWHTSIETGSHRVDYGTTNESGETLSSTVQLTEITRYPWARLSGLDADTTYFYRVTSDEQSTDTYSFRTPPLDDDDTIRLVFFADNQGGTDFFREHTIPLIEELAPEAMVNGGDVVESGSEYADWGGHLYEPARDILRTIPWFPARGNHDGEHPLARDMLPLPNGNQWYAQSYGPFRIVVMDTNQLYTHRSPQLEWLEAEVASEAWRRARFRIVSLHKPPFTSLWDNATYDGEPGGRATLVPMFESHGVDLVLAGHTHGYEHGIRPRSDGGVVHYVVSGGAGGNLDTVPVFRWPHIEVSLSRHSIVIVETTPEGLDVRAIDPTNREELDRFTVPAVLP